MAASDLCAAVGLRAHSGWAALVAVVGPWEAVSVVLRRRVDLADPETPGSKQPYHAAEELPAEKAADLIARFESASRRLAAEAFREALRELEEKGYRVVGCGLLLAAGRELPALASILASHALIHTADGEHFRDALRRASLGCSVPVVGVREGDLMERAARAMEVGEDALLARLAAMGRSLGPPWTRDQKLAAIAAAVALAESTGSGAVPRASGPSSW